MERAVCNTKVLGRLPAREIDLLAEEFCVPRELVVEVVGHVGADRRAVEEKLRVLKVSVVRLRLRAATDARTHSVSPSDFCSHALVGSEGPPSVPGRAVGHAPTLHEMVARIHASSDRSLGGGRDQEAVGGR